jgi:hypothetical protein
MILMNTLESAALQSDAQHILASAVAHQVERMSKDELQTLVANAHVELQNENAVLKERIKQLEEKNAELEAENLRLLYRISRSLFDEKDYENFDPSEYTVPVEEMLAEARALLDEP